MELFYGRSEVSVKTLLIFFCGQVSRENCCKNGGYSFIIFVACAAAVSFIFSRPNVDGFIILAN